MLTGEALVAVEQTLLVELVCSSHQPHAKLELSYCVDLSLTIATCCVSRGNIQTFSLSSYHTYYRTLVNDCDPLTNVYAVL